MAQHVGQRSPDGLWLWNGAEWVPNAPAVTQPSAVPWARPYESAHQRARLLTISLLINVAGLVLLIGLEVLLAAVGPQTPNDALTVVLDIGALAVLVAFLGSLIPSIVFFCMWVHRVVGNMPALGASDPRWSPSGAVVRCFIPFLNLAHPMSGTLEAWRGSDPSRRWLNVSERKAMRAPGVIIGWWALWLIGNLVINVGDRLTGDNDAATVATGELISAAGIGLLIGAAIFAVVVVRRVTARQDDKNELIATGRLA